MTAQVLIPIYKKIPANSEVRSLLQCFKILKNHSICFVCGNTFDIQCYEELISDKYSFGVKRFNDRYFSSISSYNKLLISKKFYRKFKNCEYILIYQLDAWVFYDQLDYWCSSNFDYIGAPWFEGWSYATNESEFAGVGNGGFSLRKVSSFIKVLHSFSYIEKTSKLFVDFKAKPSIKSFLKFIKKLLIANNTFFLLNNYPNNEDNFWGYVAGQNFNFFKIPDLQTASRFSMELNAPNLYKQNNNELPFGCHAWNKYNTKFWSQFIITETDTLS